MERKKLLQKVLNSSSQTNVTFQELLTLLSALGFSERKTGSSHHIFTKEEIEEIIIIQPDGSKAKTYQIKQIKKLIEKYELSNFFDSETETPE